MMHAAESPNQPCHEPHASSHMLQVESPLNRRRVEAFIQRCFRQDYAAQIDVYAKHLIALIDTEQQIQAAVGYQSAASGALFMEQYLDQPIEQRLSQTLGRAVRREQVLEVGNLASRSSGGTRQIILELALFYYRQGFEWLVITVTPQVLNSFHKLGVGLELIPLCAADPNRLLQDPARWGSYYREQPLVMAGHIGRGIARLRKNRALLRQLLASPKPLRDHQIQLAPEGDL
ncbi:MAG: thermostable hemolysin [Motiliproteus sp.]